MLVDRPRHQLLAGAALAGDQHGKALVGDMANRLVRFLHPRAASDDQLAGDLFVRRGLRDNGRLAHQPSHFEGLADHAVQLLQIDRLEQVVVGPVPRRLDGRVSRSDHGDEDDRDACVELSKLRQDIQSRLVRQAQVEENNVRAMGGDLFQALCPRASDINPMFGRGEHVGHLLGEQVWVVINQEQVGH